MKVQTGLMAYRILRPKKSETYIILFQWTNKRAYDIWKKYDPFAYELEHFSVGVKKTIFLMPQHTLQLILAQNKK